MENKAHALIAGLFTILLLAGAVFIGIWLNRDRVQWVPYLIATKMSVPGLNPQASVRYRGLDVGKVDDLGFDPKETGQILIHIRVQPDTPITQSTYATLGYQGVTGIAYIDLDDDGSSKERVSSTKKKVAPIEMRPGVIDQLQTRGLAILAQTEEMAKRINSLLEPENREAILTAVNNVGGAAKQLETIPKQMQPTLSKLPALTAQAQEALSSLASLSKDAKVLAVNLNEITARLNQTGGALDNISDSASRFGGVATRLEYDLPSLTNDAHASMRNLNRTLDNLNEHPSSLLFGAPPPVPGPGEAGFVAPAGKP
jgi:phospholipid/cholesterol/gamma-HCH transport system substrate-binding protein